MKLLIDLSDKIDQWEEDAKAALLISGQTKDQQIKIMEHISDNHATEIRADMTELDQAELATNTQLDNMLTADEVDDIHRTLERIEELRQRLFVLL